MTLQQNLEMAKEAPDMLQELIGKLSSAEVVCQKYHYTVNGGPQVFEKYIASFKLTKSGKRLRLYNYKPQEGYKMTTQK